MKKMITSTIEYENLNKLNKQFENDYILSFQELLDSGQYVLGSKVTLFEEEFAKYVGNNYCIGVSSGLDALRLSLDVYLFAKESEVIVPSNTYIATILAIIQAGLKPVLAEPDINTYNLELFEHLITKKTVAILPVHLYGRPCDMNSINKIASEYSLKVIEDCAQSHGALNKHSMGCYSFYPTKNLGCLGDGGAIVLDDLDIAQKLKSLRNYGRVAKYENENLGWNNRLDEIQAGFLSIKLKKLNDIIKHKRRLAKIYDENLVDNVIKPKYHSDHVYHIYNIRTGERDALKEHLSRNNIQTEIHYPIPPHQQKALAGYFVGNYPISSEIHATTLSLPISYCHNDEQIYRVTDVINAFFG